MVLYTGTFEAYQGLDLLFEAMAHVRAARPEARLLLAGGKPDQVERARRAGARGRDRRRRRSSPASGRPSEIPAYLLACDVLVSPRSRGTNTPLKIYQYLRSGKPIVATRLLTHTQVLERRDGDSHRRRRRANSPTASWRRSRTARARPRSAARARELAETKYSYDAYLERTRQACAALLPVGAAAVRGRVKDVA